MVLLVYLLLLRYRTRRPRPLPVKKKIKMLGLIWEVTGAFQADHENIDTSTANFRTIEHNLIKGPFCPECGVPVVSRSQNLPETCGHCNHNATSADRS